MKRTITMILLLALLLPLFALSETTGEKAIQFRGLEWYITKKEVDEALIAEGAEKTLLSSNEGDIYRLSAIESPGTTSGRDRVDDGGFFEIYRGLNVAGYAGTEVNACYYYSVEDGIIDRDEDNAIFYFGWYEFEWGRYSDYLSIYDDLLTKLSSLYGAPETTEGEYYIIATWRDMEGSTLQLLIDDDHEYITLGYIAHDADERLDAVQSALDAEKAAAEEIEREKNKDNTDGL